jgi:hypothetical protein
MNILIRIAIGAIIGGTIGTGIGLACKFSNKRRAAKP